MDETPSTSPQGEPSGDKGDAPSAEDQAALIERIIAGEVELFLELIQPHEKTLRAVSHSILQNDADAEEVVQETFLKALAHLDQLRTCQCFKGWLLQIAVNEARKRLREQRLYSSRSVEREETETDQADFVPRDFAGWRDLPSLSLERKELWAGISRALSSLDGIYREVFVLRDMQHLAVSQAAMILGLSEACVTTRLHRARLQMREQLAPLFGRSRTGWVPMQAVIANKYMQKIMRCDQVVPQLPNYIDGNLDPQQRRKIERHLKLCRNCAVLLDSMRKLLYIVGDDKVFVPPFQCSQRWEGLLSGLSETGQPTTEGPAKQFKT